MRLYPILATTILFSVTLSYPALQRAYAVTLDEMVSTTLSTHPQVESSRIDVATARQDEREQVSSYFPNISLSATGGRQYGDNATSRGLSVTRGAGYSYLWEGSITGRQMLWDGKETENLIDAARAQQRAARLSLVDVREQLAFQAIQTYINLARAKQGLSMVIDYRQQVESYLGRITDMVDEGAADEAEAQQAREVLLLLKNMEADYEGQVEVAISEYVQLADEMPEGPLSVPAAPVHLIPAGVEAAVQEALNNHTAIQAAQQQARAANYETDAEMSAYSPDFNGELSYLKTDKRDIIGGEASDARAVVRMNWDLPTGGALDARVKRSRLLAKAAQSDVEEVMRGIEAGVRFAYAENETARRQMDNQIQREELSRGLFSTYETQFEGAMVSLLQLMQADNQFFNARLETMNARYRYVLSQYGILGSLGLLHDALGLSPVPSDDKIDEEEVTQVTTTHEQTAP